MSIQTPRLPKRIRYFILPLLLIANAAFAQTMPAPFSCAVQPDGVSVRVTIANPHANDAHCTAHCEFNTTKAGTLFIVECGASVGAGVADKELCVKTFDSGRVTKLAEGKGECLNSAVKAEDDKDDEDNDAMIQRLQQQSKDFIDAARRKP